jgi:Protein of unknown function (DUF2971)
MMAQERGHSDGPNAKTEFWRSRLQDFQTQLWADYDSRTPAKMYHYSSMRGICGILSSREVWASNVRSMKDPLDGLYWLQLFRDATGRNSVPNYVQHWFQAPGSFGLETHWNMYISCFSERKDLEHQWKYYADEGRGCAIEISFGALSASADGGKKLAWMKMLYDPGQQKEMADRTVKQAVYFAREQRLTSSEAKLYWQRYAAFSFLQGGIHFKRPNCEPEQEWRVFIVKTDLNGVRYRDGDGGAQISYLGVPIGPELVTKLARRATCEMGKQKLLSLLEEKGYTQQIVDLD